MKLYATTTSERASKGQGGNEFLNIELTAEIGGERVVIITIKARHNKTKEGEYCGSFDFEIETPKYSGIGRYINCSDTSNLYSLEDRTKGKKLKTAKGKECDECGRYLSDLDYANNNGKCQLDCSYQ